MQDLHMVSNTPGNFGNLLEICKVSWKLSDGVRLFDSKSLHLKDVQQFCVPRRPIIACFFI